MMLIKLTAVGGGAATDNISELEAARPPTTSN